MTIDSVSGVGPCQLVARYCRSTVARLPALVRAAVILLPLVRYGRLMIRSLML